MNYRQTQLDWLVTMSKQEGSKAHAWHRAQELDSDQSGLFTGIAVELKAHMLKLNKERQQTGGLNEPR
jgi:hypothetical protein